MPSQSEPASTSVLSKVRADLPFNVDERRRLFDLLTDDYDVQMWDFKAFLTRTHGTSAAFIQETVRLAVGLAATDNDAEPIQLTDAHVSAALDEMLDAMAAEMSSSVRPVADTGELVGGPKG